MGVPEPNLKHFLRCTCNKCSWGLNDCRTTYSFWLMVLPKQVFYEDFFLSEKRKIIQALSDLTCYCSRRKKVSCHPALLFNNWVFLFFFSGGQHFFFFPLVGSPCFQSKILFLSLFILSPIVCSEGDLCFTSCDFYQLLPLENIAAAWKL